MPRSPDLVIVVLTTDTTDYFTPCACAWDKNSSYNPAYKIASMQSRVFGACSGSPRTMCHNMLDVHVN